MSQPTLSVQDLSVAYRARSTEQTAVEHVSFVIAPGEAYGLVGESGCGKSTIAYSVVNYLAPNAVIQSGQILVEGVDTLKMTSSALKTLRGRQVAMVYQNPTRALNPSMTVGEQIREVLDAHPAAIKRSAKHRTIEVLEQVRFPEPAMMMSRYPHQLSGGQQQRVVIAMALSANPRLLILDEPTTGLDATVEAAVLDLVTDLRRRLNVSLLLISHNLAVVSKVCERAGILYAGRIVEEGPVSELFHRPGHPYTRGLLRSVPGAAHRKGVNPLVPIPGTPVSAAEAFTGCRFAPRCDFVRDVCRESEPSLEPSGGSLSRCYFHEEVRAAAKIDRGLVGGAKDLFGMPARNSIAGPLLSANEVRKTYQSGAHKTIAVDGVSIAIGPRETFGLVGESGSGKSTMARLIAGLLVPDEGSVVYQGKDVSVPVERRSAPDRRDIQMVFQDPESTLNPRHRVRQLLRRAVEKLSGKHGSDADRNVRKLMAAVNLDSAYLDVLPGQLSGGQKQRVAIARALAGSPKLVAADEPVSALDVSVQAAILNLLERVQEENNVAYLFISHDLAVIRYLADHVGVMYLGRLVEVGPASKVFEPPHHPYTEALFASVPTIDGDPLETGMSDAPVRIAGTASPTYSGAGCVFAGRCRRQVGPQCEQTDPPWQQLADGHAIRCWIGFGGRPED